MSMSIEILLTEFLLYRNDWTIFNVTRVGCALNFDSYVNRLIGTFRMPSRRFYERL